MSLTRGHHGHNADLRSPPAASASTQFTEDAISWHRGEKKRQPNNFFLSSFVPFAVFSFLPLSAP